MLISVTSAVRFDPSRTMRVGATRRSPTVGTFGAFDVASSGAGGGGCCCGAVSGTDCPGRASAAVAAAGVRDALSVAGVTLEAESLVAAGTGSVERSGAARTVVQPSTETATVSTAHAARVREDRIIILK